ncbi:MAG TPA: response regulator transcription factor [Eoetvoesiella sp.]|uniref:response regulator transcription factor n=1 Tax=Eoetvoesiella sp. TaxID=1966355 RepID=UPI002C18F6A4|nr:response regulator transcription factor [Eoetvoesiella sp.]HWK61665.1 response regulator transcription factor [Eoetvoesiella sp.]
MHTPRPVAVVEDNPGLLADLVEFLGMRGFAARGFASAEAFFKVWPATSFDLLLLDVVLPGASGLEVAQRVRAQRSLAAQVGIVMLTALDANNDHVLGLEAGADMYLSKRSSLEVIEAACHSMLRRLDQREAAQPADDGHEPWRLNALHWLLKAPDGSLLSLTHAEVTVLSALFDKPGQAVAREELLTRLNKKETLSSLRNLDNTISRLRRKVHTACDIELPVRPSYGRGYTFTGECETNT